MEIYEPLPANLKSNYKESLGSAVREQLEYLWKAAHAVSSSKDLAHSLARRFVEVGDKHGLHYPEEVRRRLCNYCSNILLPSITASIRIRPRGRQSKRKVLLNNNVSDRNNVDKDGKRSPRKLKNQVVTHCNTCQHVSSITGGCYRVNRAHVSKHTDGTDPAVTASNNPQQHRTDSCGSSSSSQRKPEPKFSFLKKLDRQASSAPSKMTDDFIPLSATAWSGGTISRNSSNNSNKSNNSSEKDNSQNKMTAQVGGKRSLSLADLEQAKKKQKKLMRKSLSPVPEPSRLGKSPSAATGGGAGALAKSSSLNSLQGLFAKKR